MGGQDHTNGTFGTTQPVNESEDTKDASARILSDDRSTRSRIFVERFILPAGRCLFGESKVPTPPQETTSSNQRSISASDEPDDAFTAVTGLPTPPDSPPSSSVNETSAAINVDGSTQTELPDGGSQHQKEQRQWKEDNGELMRVSILKAQVGGARRELRDARETNKNHLETIHNLRKRKSKLLPIPWIWCLTYLGQNR